MAKRLPTFEGSDNPTVSPQSDSPPLGPVPLAHDAKTHTTTQHLAALTPDGAEHVDSDDDKAEVFECAICLQTCIHPVQLPCSHIFCFLCVKGVAIQSKRCALCRQDIPVDFFNNPSLLRRGDLYKESAFEGCYQWYYQGINGWWQYDERASLDIEEHFKAGNKHLEILIAGFLYVIDYDNMLQFRRNDPSRRRKIKRDLVSIPDKKGVAGLKVRSPSPQPDSPQRPQGDGGENVPCVVQNKQSKAKSQTGSSRTTYNHDNPNNLALRAIPGQSPVSKPGGRNQSHASSRAAALGTDRDSDISISTTRPPQINPGQERGELTGNIHPTRTSRTNHTDRGELMGGMSSRTPRTNPGTRSTISTSPTGVPHNTPEGQFPMAPNPLNTAERELGDQASPTSVDLSSRLAALGLDDVSGTSSHSGHSGVAQRTRSSRSRQPKLNAEQKRSFSSDEEEWQ